MSRAWWDLGPHAAFIWASYALVALVLGAVALSLVLDGRRRRRELEELEAGGVSRRPRGRGRAAQSGSE